MADDNNTVDRQAAMEEFRRLLEDEKDLYIGDPPDEMAIVKYLIYANYNVQEAFHKMKKLFQIKEEYSDFFAQRRDPEVHDVILSRGMHQMLDQRDQLGRRIYLLKMSKFELGEFQPCQLMQVDDLWFSLALDEEDVLNNGVVIIMDMEKLPWSFVRIFSPYNTKAMTTKSENIPVRNIQYHVLNSGYVVNILVRITFPFLSQATKESIFFHKNLKSLHEHVSPSALPREYGGEGPPLDSEKLVREYLDPNNERLAEVLSYGYRREVQRTSD